MRFELAPFALPDGYGESVLARADAKAHLAIEAAETAFDDEVAAYRDAAVDMVERYCSLYLAPRTGVVWRAESLPAGCWQDWNRGLTLGAGPVTAITAVTYLDYSGTRQAFDETRLRLGARGEVFLKQMQAWPGDVTGGIEITFDAGYVDDTRPAALVQAVRQFMAHLFLNREAVSTTGAIVSEIPLGFRDLCQAYRGVVI